MTRESRAVLPPFAFRVEVPDDWTIFDTSAEGWQRSTEALLDVQKEGARRLSGAERRGALRILADVAAVARATGACVSATKFASAAGPPFIGTLTLAWFDSAPIEPDLAFVQLVAGEQGTQEIMQTDLATGLQVAGRTEWDQPLPWLMAEGCTFDTQIYLPVPGTTWTALCTGATTNAAHAELMTKTVRRMATSLEPDLPKAAPQADLRSRLRAATRAVPADQPDDTPTRED
ncbi:hypothetical protein [Herbidospora daliensis]|uniref:hypothetical protein n=1 Tax=Herbidospora daliensis TaxID=295585 RepID=UPI0007865921|nr:hypothetical protein [Herbidospora daliensis]